MMAKRLILLFLIFLFIYACTPKPKSYESATKWHTECNPFPNYHLGDYYTVEDDFINEAKGCGPECSKKYMCSEGRGYASCVQNTNSCIKSCYEEIAKAHSIAIHTEGGYYSDGSYYAGCHPLYFSNIHPTADKYKKTKWQTDRDECMKLTSENVKKKVLQTEWSFIGRAKNYYKSCLKERGY